MTNNLMAYFTDEKDLENKIEQCVVNISDFLRKLPHAKHNIGFIWSLKGAIEDYKDHIKYAYRNRITDAMIFAIQDNKLLTYHEQNRLIDKFKDNLEAMDNNKPPIWFRTY